MLEMPPPQNVETKGVRVGFYEAGPKGDAPPFVLCHGWPELAFSWRHQIQALSEAGFRVIAPDQRGFGLSDRPEAVEAYDLTCLTGDLVGLLDHLKIDKAIFVGHDWGGAVVWRMAQEFPDRVAGVVGINTPHPRLAPVDPIEILRRRYGDDHYIVQFQSPGREPDRIFAANVEKTFDFLMRAPLPRREGRWDKPNLALPQLVAAYDPARDRRSRVLDDEEMAVYVETFRRTGFTAGINWYRNITLNWRRAAELPEILGVPALMIMSELDVVLPPSAADGMEARLPDLEKRLILGCGHWTMQERPEEVSTLLIDWRRRRFG